MRLLFVGDVVAESGCKAITRYIPQLKKQLELDCVIVNAENAAFHGMTQEIVQSFYDAGVDGITSGNHMWDHTEIYDFIDEDPCLIRPMNLIQERPGKGWTIIDVKGQKVLLINALGKLFMKDPITCPFADIMNVVEAHPLKQKVDAILVDFHTETTAEKNALGAWLDGKVSVVVGTHTHMPTADHQILPNGTAYQTDAGMTCDYNSVIGMDREIGLEVFLGKRSHKEGILPATGEATLCGLLVNISDDTGLAESVEPVRVGGRLAQTHPISSSSCT